MKLNIIKILNLCWILVVFVVHQIYMHISLGLYISFDCLLSKYSYFVLSILFFFFMNCFTNFDPTIPIWPILMFFKFFIMMLPPMVKTTIHWLFSFLIAQDFGVDGLQFTIRRHRWIINSWYRSIHLQPKHEDAYFKEPMH